MAARTFTLAEVNALIPSLERIFADILQLRGGLRALEQKLAGAGIEVTKEVLEDDAGPAELRKVKALFRAYYEEMVLALERIRELGGEVKDIDVGLVDFPGRRDGQEILLCWRAGERSCGFWHTTDTGFAGRRPIDDRVSADPPRAD